MLYAYSSQIFLFHIIMTLHLSKKKYILLTLILLLIVVELYYISIFMKKITHIINRFYYLDRPYLTKEITLVQTV